jgi:hypothetical protein
MTDTNAQESHDAQKIRRLAAKQELAARKSRKDHKWRFTDHTNTLKSPEQGLDDQEALDFLGQQ